MTQLVAHLRRSVVHFQRHTRQSSNSSRPHASFLIEDPKYAFLKDLGLQSRNSGVYNGKWSGSGEIYQSVDPSTGRVIAEVQGGTEADLEECIRVGHEAYGVWSRVPAPRRGEIVRQIGEELRKNLHSLGKCIDFADQTQRPN